MEAPHLVQEFFCRLCINAGLNQTILESAALKPKPSAQELLKQIASDLSRPVFDALAKGPRQRTRRKQRPFQDGREGDLYLATLNAMATLKPTTDGIEYEEIRKKLKELLVDLPEAHEVSRVLGHVANIKIDDTASAPVLDWDKKQRRLHITDPYFAFYLRWAADVFLKGRKKR